MKKISKMHQKVIDKENLAKGISNNNFWDDAKTFYFQAINAINQVQGQLVTVLDQFVYDAEKFKLIEDQQGLVNNVSILNRDIQEHIDRLNAIYAKHSHKSGGTISPDDHMAVLQINCDYSDALQIYDANIVPTMQHILEQIGVAEEIVRAQELQAQQQEEVPPVRDFSQDTAVIDVEFEEIKK